MALRIPLHLALLTSLSNTPHFILHLSLPHISLLAKQCPLMGISYLNMSDYLRNVAHLRPNLLSISVVWTIIRRYVEESIYK